MNPAIYGDVLDGRRRTKNSTSRKTSTSAVTTEKSIMSFAATAATTISSAAVRHLSFGAFSRIPTPLFSLTRTNSTTSSNKRRMVSISNQNSPSTSEPDPPPEKPKPWLIVGLGNPGKLYSRTRHNVGFEMVDYIAEAEGISMKTVSFKALFGKGHIGNVPVMLAKPQTFMNASGESVGPIVSYYKIPLNQVLVIFDDMDLPFAKLRMLPKGGHGGHNGMRSIINHLKGKDSKDAGKDFPRLRIGIGRPPGKMNPVSFVMRAFDKQERQELDFTLQTGLEAVRILLLEGFNKSATFVNSPKTIEQLQ